MLLVPEDPGLHVALRVDGAAEHAFGVVRHRDVALVVDRDHAAVAAELRHDFHDDFVGRARSEENSIPVDTRSDYDGPGGPQHFRDSTDVSRWLAQNPTAHECFARQAYRFFSGDGAGQAEAAFLAVRAQLPEARRRDLFQTLVAFIASPAFVERSAPAEQGGAEARR